MKKMNNNWRQINAIAMNTAAAIGKNTQNSAIAKIAGNEHVVHTE